MENEQRNFYLENTMSLGKATSSRYAELSQKLAKKAVYRLGLTLAVGTRQDSPLIKKKLQGWYDVIPLKHLIPQYHELRLNVWVFDKECDFEYMKSSYSHILTVNLDDLPQPLEYVVDPALTLADWYNVINRLALFHGLDTVIVVGAVANNVEMRKA